MGAAIDGVVVPMSGAIIAGILGQKREGKDETIASPLRKAANLARLGGKGRVEGKP